MKMLSSFSYILPDDPSFQKNFGDHNTQEVETERF